MRTYLHAIGFGDDKHQNEEQEEQEVSVQST